MRLVQRESIIVYGIWLFSVAFFLTHTVPTILHMQTGRRAQIWASRCKKAAAATAASCSTYSTLHTYYSRMHILLVFVSYVFFAPSFETLTILRRSPPPVERLCEAAAALYDDEKDEERGQVPS